MFTFQELLFFITAAAVIAIAPGPDTLLTSSRTLTQGTKSGILTMLGILAGSYIQAILVALGLSSIIAEVPIVYQVIKWAGVLYLSYLALSALFSNAKAKEKQDVRRVSSPKIFVDGLMNNLLNPKVALFSLAIYPQFWHPERGSIIFQAMILASIFNILGFLVLGSTIFLTARFHKRMAASLTFQKVSKYLMSAVFGALALRIAISHRN